MVTFAWSSILTAFSSSTIGSKVINTLDFLAHLTKAIEQHDSSKDQAPGQMFVVLPKEAFCTVSAGDGMKTNNPEDYVVRTWRGEVGTFLKREKAGSVNFLAVIVYTAEAYNKDPDVIREGRLVTDSTHVIVAVLASAGPKPVIGEHRLLLNVLGGNNKFKALWGEGTQEEKLAQMQLFLTEAKESTEYNKTWSVVAD